MTNKDIRDLIMHYGGMTMLWVMDYFEKQEKFEICTMIREEIVDLNSLGADIPLKLDVDNYEADYKQSLHKLGLKGDIAFENNVYQIEECIGLINSYE